MHDMACKVGSDCSMGVLLNSLHVDLNGYINPLRHKLRLVLDDFYLNGDASPWDFFNKIYG